MEGRTPEFGKGAGCEFPDIPHVRHIFPSFFKHLARERLYLAEYGGLDPAPLGGDVKTSDSGKQADPHKLCLAAPGGGHHSATSGPFPDTSAPYVASRSRTAARHLKTSETENPTGKRTPQAL